MRVVDEKQDTDRGRKLIDCSCCWLDWYYCRARTATLDNKQVRKQPSASLEVVVTLANLSDCLLNTILIFHGLFLITF